MVYKGISRCRQENRVTRLGDVYFRQPTGKEGFFVITISPIEGDDGTHWGFSLLATDITERRLAQKALSKGHKE